MKNFWSGKRVLVTGHTGFKGSWLSLWLHRLGAQVIGYALEPPTSPNMFESIGLNNDIISIYGDIRDKEKLSDVFKEYGPEIVFHLAAQPIVRRSYANPIETLEVNIIGTANLLDVIRNSETAKAIVNITSDKCYENKEWAWGYRETDPMGGFDPYSCSKGCSELITNSFRSSYFKEKGIQLASARAGNVIGGGDWAEDRLVPDIVKSLLDNKTPIIRSPYAVRPWQHVLEPLHGYMLLAEMLYNSDNEYSEGWNFGPDDSHIITVFDLADKLMRFWGSDESLACDIDRSAQPHEAQILKLDSSKAKSKLGWRQSQLSIEETLKWTIDWYKAFYYNGDIRELTIRQIDEYEKLEG